MLLLVKKLVGNILKYYEHGFPFSFHLGEAPIGSSRLSTLFLPIRLAFNTRHVEKEILGMVSQLEQLPSKSNLNLAGVGPYLLLLLLLH